MVPFGVMKDPCAGFADAMRHPAIVATVIGLERTTIHADGFHGMPPLQNRSMMSLGK